MLATPRRGEPPYRKVGPIGSGAQEGTHALATIADHSSLPSPATRRRMSTGPLEPFPRFLSDGGGLSSARSLPPMIRGVIPAMGTASAAIGAQFRRFEQSATRVATQNPAPDYVRETVEQMGSNAAVTANVAVIRAADEMTESLFSVWA